MQEYVRGPRLSLALKANALPRGACQQRQEDGFVRRALSNADYAANATTGNVLLGDLDEFELLCNAANGVADRLSF
jgi:hypothetical protein